jgi:hypothetical protein
LTRSTSLTVGPRPIFIKTAEGFINENVDSVFIKSIVSSVFGRIETT